jgi:hypothetical protein
VVKCLEALCLLPHACFLLMQRLEAIAFTPPCACILAMNRQVTGWPAAVDIACSCVHFDSTVACVCSSLGNTQCCNATARQLQKHPLSGCAFVLAGTLTAQCHTALCYWGYPWSSGMTQHIPAVAAAAAAEVKPARAGAYSLTLVLTVLCHCQKGVSHPLAAWSALT